MVCISDFTSVFEIAFAIHFILFFLEIFRKSDSEFRELTEIHYNLYLKKKQITGNSDVFPLKFVIQGLHGHQLLFSMFASASLSILSLWFLIYSGFYPEAQISGYWMALVLLATFCSIPFVLSSYSKAHKGSVSLIKENIESLKEQINNAEKSE